ncbi:glutathione S-transferase family protein [Roseovarius autotrophicus]|uniref:glutathione S-transferase family protein n=1 Tax=Roseovarius autotrophicus TaxID=2824121 RepID=UPI0019E5B997|nr:glutathione S-transferase family protein [Roseovarius autotrophicus]MBE0452571.1 glutathione S-transferase family protein [Roseovarius sp.]
MQLYYARGTIAVAVAIALHEAGLGFEAVRLDFKAGDQTRPDYHAINPKGRVPALVTDHGILTETGAIMDYIADLAPQARLRPEDPYEAAQMRAAMYYLASTMHVNHAHRARGLRWADEDSSIADMKAKAVRTMTESAQFVETHMLRGPFVMGGALSLADPYLFVAASWLEGDGVDLGLFPKIRAFREAMAARASVARVVADGMI